MMLDENGVIGEIKLSQCVNISPISAIEGRVGLVANYA